jgi:hypothetical protein
MHARTAYDSAVYICILHKHVYVVNYIFTGYSTLHASQYIFPSYVALRIEYITPFQQ